MSIFKVWGSKRTGLWNDLRLVSMMGGLDDEWSEMITKMKTQIVSSPPFCNFALFVLWVSIFRTICDTSGLCLQALRPADVVDGEPKRRQSVRLQAPAEEDVAETKAHQAVLNRAGLYNGPAASSVTDLKHFRSHRRTCVTGFWESKIDCK